MAGEIIRQGDRTSHGGTVLEGSPFDICMGKPIAFIGHKVICPKCKGIFSIAEGVSTTTFYGKGIAIAGMKTSCGATLIASQFTDTVSWSTGSSDAEAATIRETPQNTATPAGLSEDFDSDDVTEDVEVEHFYSLTDEHGNALSHYRYDLYTDQKLHKKAESYIDGSTVAVVGEAQTLVVVWIDRDSAGRA